MNPFCINFYTDVYFLYIRVLNPGIYLGPGIYMSPASIRINAVYVIQYYIEIIPLCNKLTTNKLHEV